MADGWRGPRSRRIERSAGALALLLVAVVAASCGGEDEAARTPVTVTTAPSRSTPTQSTTTTTSAAPTTTVFAFGFDQQLISKVWADYEAAIDVLEATLNDPSSPLTLNSHFAGAMLDRWQAVREEMRRAGQYAYFPHNSIHREELRGVALIDPTTIDLTVCTWDDAVVANRTTGEIVDDDSTILRSRERMHLSGGRWRQTEREGKYVGEAECAGLS